MNKKRYEIDDRKPSLLPKIGTAVVAIGSLASAAAMAAPSITDFSNFIESSNSQPAPAAQQSSQPNVTLPSKQVDTDEGGSSFGVSSAETATTEQASNIMVNAPAASEPQSAAPSQTEALQPTEQPTEQPTKQAALEPIGSSAGNVSSPTPSGSSSSWGNSEAVGAPVGNTSSATPGGGYYEDDDDDNYEDDDRHEDHDDDDHDDDDRSWWDFGHDDVDDDHDDDD